MGLPLADELELIGDLIRWKNPINRDGFFAALALNCI
jgi:hypothetical protein